MRRGVFFPGTRRVAASSGEAGSPLDPWQPPEPPAGAILVRRALGRTSDAVSAETGERPPAAAPAGAGSTGRCPSPTGVGDGVAEGAGELTGRRVRFPGRHHTSHRAPRAVCAWGDEGSARRPPATAPAAETRRSPIDCKATLRQA